MVPPLVTISIPLYNCEEFLERCLESVLKQTYPHIEVILINDQTKDNSVKIAEDFISRHNLEQWKIIHLEENSGLSVVRNKGIDLAAGKYLFFLDSDDEILPETILKMVEIAEKNNLQMVVGNVVSINAASGEISDMFSIKSKKDFLCGNSEIFKNFVAGMYPTSSWNKLTNVEFLRKNQLYFSPGLYAQDALQSFQTALKLQFMGFLRENTYRYYLHENSVIHNRQKRHFDNWMTIASEIDKTLQREKNPERRKLILQHLVEFKSQTLVMNWKAQKDETLWKESYRNYKRLSKLSLSDYFSSQFQPAHKKADLFNRLPTELGFRFFKWRFYR